MTGVGKAQLLVKGARASLACTNAGQQLARAGALAHVRDHLAKGLSPIAASLKSLVDHQSPQTALPLCRIVVEHYKTDRRFIDVNGTEPCDLAIEVRLRYRDSVGGDEALLLRRDLQLQYVAQVIFGDFPECNSHIFHTTHVVTR